MNRVIGIGCLLACLLAGCCGQQKAEDEVVGYVWMDELKLNYLDIDGVSEYPIRFEAREALEHAWARAKWTLTSGYGLVTSGHAPPELVWNDGGGRNSAYTDDEVLWLHHGDCWISTDRGLIAAVKAAIRDRLAQEGKPDPYQ